MHICETSTYRFKSKNSTAAYICTSSFMIGSTEFIIVHMDYDKNHMYLLKKYCDKSENTKFNTESSNDYNTSILKTKCIDYYDNLNPLFKSCLVEISEGHGCPVFIPTLMQLTNGFTYLKGNMGSRTAREFKTMDGVKCNWWTQSAYRDDRIYYVLPDGGIKEYGVPSDLNGFRPCMAVDLSKVSKV